MDITPVDQSAARATDCESLLNAVAAAIPAMRRRAPQLDAEARFPEADLDELRALGLLLAPLPSDLGGLGLGTEPQGADGLRRLLGLLGRGNMAIGRVFEAHVNAIALIARHATTAQLAAAAADVRAGHLFALWVTGQGLLIDGSGFLDGTLSFCSAAGWASRAVVTALRPGAAHPDMLVADTAPAKIERLPSQPQGMRAAATGRVRFDATPLSRAAMFGQPDDYLREPGFTAGAWRTYAVIAGGLEALVQATQEQLVARDRHTDPHQQVRIGQALIAQETARLWIRQAALLAEAAHPEPQRVTAYVNLARSAIEAACLETISLVQRSLGLAALVPPNPAERLMRDLATYLRQPAGDEALTEAAAWCMQHRLSVDTA